MKKLNLIITIIIFICLLTGCNSNINSINQNKEYDLQKPEVVLADIFENRNWEDYNDFYVNNIYTYEEYLDYCKKYELNIVYNNSDSNYIIVSTLAIGWYEYLEVTDIIKENDICFIKIKDGNYGIATSDVCGYVLVVPCSKDIKNIDLNIEYIKDNNLDN